MLFSNLFLLGENMSPPKKSSRLLDASDAHLLEQECNCELTPKHENAEHDWCCQICGGNHTERLCPENNTQCAKMDECSNKGKTDIEGVTPCLSFEPCEFKLIRKSAKKPFLRY